MSKNFEEFSTLPKQLQLEAIREGEARLQAQLSIATAADSRALAWSGLVIAAATASLGAGLALLNQADPDYVLALITLSFSGSMLIAAHRALSTVNPQRFSLPGNRPDHWLPSEWDCIGSENRKVATAQREQAECLTDSIKENSLLAEQRAQKMNSSFDHSWQTVALTAIAVALVLGSRAFFELVPMSWQSFLFHAHSPLH